MRYELLNDDLVLRFSRAEVSAALDRFSRAQGRGSETDTVVEQDLVDAVTHLVMSDVVNNH
jgi:hypothetical protein